MHPGPLVHDTPERPDLIGRDVPALTAAERQQMWQDKMIEFAQMLNGGYDVANPQIQMQFFGLLDESKASGYYKVI